MSDIEECTVCARAVRSGEPCFHGGVKYDAGKPDWSLLHWHAVEQVVGVATFGAAKYEPDGWKGVRPLRNRYLSAVMRHLFAWMRGERADSESGYSHLAHAAWGCLALLEWELGQRTEMEIERNENG